MSDSVVRWIIKRNCSASPGQLAAVFASIVALSFAIGVAFAAYGLWLVLPFVGLELLALAIAFVCFGRHAGDYEVVELRDGQLRVEQLRAMRRSTWEFALPAARLETDGERDARLYVVAGDRRIEIGADLQEERRRRLAQDLTRALRVAAG